MALPSGFLQTLLGVFSQQSAVLQPTNRAMDWVYSDIGTDINEVGAVINVPISVPVKGQTVNQNGMGYTAPTYNSYSINTVPIQLTNQLTYSVAIPSIDKINTDQKIQSLLVDPAMKEIENQGDSVITSLFTPTNFNINPVIATTNHIVKTTEFVQGKTNLTMQNVTTEDPSNLVFLQHPVCYNATLTDPQWSQESIVGAEIANEIRALGVNRVAFGASTGYDQLMPVSGTSPNQSFTNLYMTKYAIAALYRPVPTGEDKYVDSAYTIYKGLPVLLEISYNPKDRQYYMNVMAAMGAKVVRPEQGQLFSTAQ